MRRRRNKVRPAKVRCADGFRRVRLSWRVVEPITLILPADRIPLNHAVDGVMPDQFFHPKKWEMSSYMNIKPIVIPASQTTEIVDRWPSKMTGVPRNEYVCLRRGSDFRFRCHLAAGHEGECSP